MVNLILTRPYNNNNIKIDFIRYNTQSFFPSKTKVKYHVFKVND